MEQQLIVAISREYGTHGHQIARSLARRFGIAYYDRSLLEAIADDRNVDSARLKEYDEQPKKVLLSRTVRGMSNSPEQAVAEMQFAYLRQKAESGESFVIVGRCAEHILKKNPGLVSIFILGDEREKIGNIMLDRDVSVDMARKIMERHDRNRKAYHNAHCPIKWGDTRGYDVSVNVSRLPLSEMTDVLEAYIRTRAKEK